MFEAYSDSVQRSRKTPSIKINNMCRRIRWIPFLEIYACPLRLNGTRKQHVSPFRTTFRIIAQRNTRVKIPLCLQSMGKHRPARNKVLLSLPLQKEQKVIVVEVSLDGGEGGSRHTINQHAGKLAVANEPLVVSARLVVDLYRRRNRVLKI